MHQRARAKAQRRAVPLWRVSRLALSLLFFACRGRDVGQALRAVTCQRAAWGVRQVSTSAAWRQSSVRRRLPARSSEAARMAVMWGDEYRGAGVAPTPDLWGATKVQVPVQRDDARGAAAVAPPASTVLAPADITVRRANFDDLPVASRLLVQEFYGRSVWYHAQSISELNRLQQNFHPGLDGDRRHCMFVALDSKDGGIVGFCDIDGRDASIWERPDLPPRPYLSDLAVSYRQRRRGIGSALVKACEAAAAAWGYANVYLKVEATNPAGLGLYHKLGYNEARAVDEKGQILLTRSLAVTVAAPAAAAVLPPLSAAASAAASPPGGAATLPPQDLRRVGGWRPTFVGG